RLRNKDQKVKGKIYMDSDVISKSVLSFFFFFQAEDGIRDRNVTGVQTCALPISQDSSREAQEIRFEVKLRLLMLGKTRRPEMRAVFDDYIKRISRSCPIEIAEVRDAHAALKKLDADRAATVVVLDAAGKNLDSYVLAH